MKTTHQTAFIQNQRHSTGRKISSLSLFHFFWELRFIAFLIISFSVLKGAAQTADEGRAVLITGTSSGIGLRMTEVLSNNGFLVYAGVRTPEDYARLDAMENVKAVQLDVTIQDEIDAAVEWVRSEGRGLYGLINNAGVIVLEPMIEIAEEDLMFQLDVNLLGPYRITKAFADLLIESEGRVMTTSSLAGMVSGPFFGPYSISKHGVEAYTDALAAEMERFNVQVAAVEPGNYKSQILISMIERMKQTGYSAEDSRYGSMIDMITGPLDRSQYREPDDVAMAALHFMSSNTPQKRYMVVPTQFEAELTIKQMINKLIQLNEGHQFSFTRDELVAMLDEALGNDQPPSAETSEDFGLHGAIATGDLQTVKSLIEAGADLNEPEPMGGSSPLITAATFGYTDIAQELIAAGANLNHQNNDGSTPLITAAFFCRTEIVAALLEAGADPSIQNSAGATALGVVTAPFENIKPIYDFMGDMLSPIGLKLDYERIKATRPKIADMLR